MTLPIKNSDYYSSFGGDSASAPGAAGVAALILSKDGNPTRATVASKLNENCDKIGPVAYTGTPPLTRNDYYGYGRLNAKSSVTATTADTTAPTFTSAQTIHYQAVDVTFSEPMGEGALTPGNYSITAGAGTLSPTTPSKVLRISPTVYWLIWASGDMAPSGTVTIQASSLIKDVAGNALTTTSRNSTGTKRIIGVNCGNQSDPADGYQFQYTPPFLTDNGFQGNEALSFLTSDTPKTYTATNITTSGVTDPAPMAVYQTIRNEWYNQSFITYSIPNVPTGSYTVRLHFAQIYFNNVGDEVFDIYINGSLAYAGFDILGLTSKYTAYIRNFTSISPVSNTTTVELRPVLGSSGFYNASICGIEVVKP